jgi:hypothetical protein
MSKNYIDGREMNSDEYKLYSKLRMMKYRCYTETSKHYKNYGGRGIKICDEWLSNRENFIQFGLDNGYEEGLTIERINNDGDYSPENCKFISVVDQQLNKRKSCTEIIMEYENKSLNITQWAAYFGIKKLTLYKRYVRNGYVLDSNIVEKPVRNYKK